MNYLIDETNRYYDHYVANNIVTENSEVNVFYALLMVMLHVKMPRDYSMVVKVRNMKGLKGSTFQVMSWIC